MENEKTEAVEQTAPTIEPQVDTPPAEPVVAVPASKVESMDDIFVTEQNTFECEVEFYRDNDNIIVKNVDDNFDATHAGIRKITFSCKYPSQGDYEMMLNSPTYRNMQNSFRPIDMVALELTRLTILIRSWSLPQEFSRMVELDPKIVRGMTFAVSNKIGNKIIF